MVAAEFDFEPAGELKFGQVGIANLRVLRPDPDRLGREMRERVERAPKLFERAALVVDFGTLGHCPDAALARRILDALRDAGALPVALAYGTSEVEGLARTIGLPLLAKFRARYESAGAAPEPTPEPDSTASKPIPSDAPAGSAASSRIHTQPVRSGQQIYAQGRDLTVTAAVGAGAEVIADGSLHIYAPLRGRALAGARGDVTARIFCREFGAELVAIAGRYKLIEELPAALRGKAVQIWLDDETIHIEELQ